MNKELIMVFLPALSWLLFSLGGTQISDKTPGWKGWRRFILPFVYGSFCLIAKIAFWKIFITMAVTGAVYSLGYGIKTKSWVRALTLSSYGLLTIAIGLSWWNLITAVSANCLFKLSNTKLTSHIFIWKVVEGLFGLLVAISLSYLLMGLGLIW